MEKEKYENPKMILELIVLALFLGSKFYLEKYSELTLYSLTEVSKSSIIATAVFAYFIACGIIRRIYEDETIDANILGAVAVIFLYK